MSLPGENILVVGSTSYIGSFVADALAHAGANVAGLSSRECDLLDRPQVFRFLNTHPLKNCVVLFLSVLNKPVGNDFDSLQKNISMVRNFVDALPAADVRRIIYFSSIDVYGRSPKLPITERTEIQPDTWYGLAKYNCEWMMLNSGDVSCPVTVLRIPGVYGPAPNDRSVIGRLVSSIRTHGEVRIKGSGRRLRDYVFIADIPRIVSALIATNHQGVLNVATGRSYSILDLAAAAGTALQRKYEVVPEPADPTREFDLVFDNSLLRSAIRGFEFTDLSKGLQSYA